MQTTLMECEFEGAPVADTFLLNALLADAGPHGDAYFSACTEQVGIGLVFMESPNFTYYKRTLFPWEEILRFTERFNFQWRRIFLKTTRKLHVHRIALAKIFGDKVAPRTCVVQFSPLIFKRKPCTRQIRTNKNRIGNIIQYLIQACCSVLRRSITWFWACTPIFPNASCALENISIKASESVTGSDALNSKPYML